MLATALLAASAVTTHPVMPTVVETRHHATATVTRRRPPGTGCAKVRAKAFGPRHKRLVVAAWCGPRYSGVGLVRLLRQTGWTWQEMPTAYAVVRGESDGYIRAWHANRSASGRIHSIDRGLFQANSRWEPASQHLNMWDPRVASRFARRVKRQEGWRVWNAYRHGYTRQYLPEARKAIAEAKRRHVR